MASVSHSSNNIGEGSCDSSDDYDSASTNDENDGEGAALGALKAHSPALFHKIKNQRSILALLISHDKIYAGTQGGDLLIWSLETFEPLSRIHAHRGSVLCLCLSADGKLLFTSAGDALIWCTTTLERLYSIYSKYDVGDIFCVTYSSALQTIYLGAQNTSIQWYDLSQKDLGAPPDLTSHPSYRNHRFFDSKGPTGISTPRPPSASGPCALGGRDLEIDKSHIVQYAHYGYVYCMLLAQGLSNRDGVTETLISGGGDGIVKLWQLNTYRRDIPLGDPVLLENGDESVLTMALDGTVLYCGRLEGAIDVWDLDTCQLIRKVDAHTTDVLTLTIGQSLTFSGAADGIAKIFNSRHENIARWKSHENLVLASTVASYHGKDIYVTGGNDGCIAVWDISKSVNTPGKGPFASNERLLLSLEKLVSYRTVSSKPEYAQDCRRGASYLRNLFKHFGAETELLNTDDHGNPVVFARFKAEKAGNVHSRKILFYGHYDVVAAENREQSWNTGPFEMEGINGYLYGRGVSDNKGPVLAALYAVADIVAAKQLRGDIVFLIEGEEENGSRGFQKAVQRNKRLIGNIDWILLANSYWLNDEIPCLTYGLRGVVRATVEVASERPDLHSGVDGSKLVHEALKDLITLLATLTGADQEVNIPGFYDHIPPMTKAEKERYQVISNTLLRDDPGLGDVRTLAESFKARWRDPSLTVHSVRASGPSKSSIISRAATADLSIRLVPNQTTASVQSALQRTLEEAFQKLDSSNKLTIKFERNAEPWLGDPYNEIFRMLDEAIMEVWKPIGQARRQSLQKNMRARKDSKDERTSQKSPKLPPATSSTLSNGSQSLPQGTIGPGEHSHSRTGSSSFQKPLYIREGGSIPAIRFLEQEFRAPAAHLPCGQASDSAHLDNERLRLLNLYNSRDIFKKVFRELPIK